VTTDIESPAPARARPLADLLDGIRGREVRVVGDASVLIRDVAYRSSETRPGSLFFCVPGGHLDGHDFAAVACRAGAVAVVAERELGVTCTQVLVPSVRQAMGPLSAAFFSFPADRMTVVGVTGTNGKTTTTYLLESIFRGAGLVPGVIGTTGVRLAGKPVPFDRTTPEAPDLQRLLSRMVEGGVRAVAMEASSHGLEQHRVDGTRYACAVFTNLTQDHLDYHLTMEAYFDAKARLFTPDLSLRGVVNTDTREGRVLAARAEVPVVTFGMDAGSNPTVKAEDVEVSASGVRFAVDGIVVRSHLRGTFNVYNCLGAYAAARQVDIAPSIAAEGIEALRGVPGRMEPVEVGQAFPVLVDYAHTPDSVQNVLEAARALGPGRLIVVFGCGGDRDRGKRTLMGEAATRLADLTVITSDNPRSEEPKAIIAEIEPGARRGGGGYVVEPDRREAIRLAVGEAVEGDVVVIAGKGHETGQEFEGGRTVQFDDRLVAADALAERLGGGGR
jgi:UDP-N-acetylmuramoyl-L-alanyl-D-glutamate--2,6-diaminopimelate ligase